MARKKTGPRIARTRRVPILLPPALEPGGRRDTTQYMVPSRGPAETAPIEANLILISHPEGRGLGQRFRLAPGGSLEIGRSPQAEITLPDVASLSRNHARLEYARGVVILHDLHSTNGTWVNNRRIDGPTVLQSGDRIQTGAVHFKFFREPDVEHAYHMAIFDLITRDGLTEVWNKRKFDDELEREFARARRYGRELSLVLLDIDRFKQINDRHGHLAGDHVLKKLAQRLSSELRAEQVFARVGGEEFAILCPETPGDRALTLSEKLRGLVAERPFEFPAGAVAATCSFGVASLTRAMASPADLYRLADLSLYESKNAGRNRSTLWSIADVSARPEAVSAGRGRAGARAPKPA